MRLVHIQVVHFRGINQLSWTPNPHINCLIGPGDSTKTTVLDAIELALNPRFYFLLEDSDFFNGDFDTPIVITGTLSDLPSELKSDDRYGLYLRGWDPQTSSVRDEPGDGLDDALSLRVTVDRSLEAHWSIFNQRIADSTADPPTLRYKDSRQLTTTRLGPYAERHLSWGRQSVLSRLGDDPDNLSLLLATASRAARQAFREGNEDAFRSTASRAEALGKQFSVPVRERYTAALDIQGVGFTSSGIALHDGRLPLRRLGTGSSRLIVSALQHDARGSHVALIDEVEHGLEPHRIARLLKYLKTPSSSTSTFPPQIFMTTHSPVVIRELAAGDLFAVRSDGGLTSVRAVASHILGADTTQRHLRSSPDAFLARAVIVGEGKTEQGLIRGLDAAWTMAGADSLALRGVIAIDGGGIPKALVLSEHLLQLGYPVCCLFDSDQPPDATVIASLTTAGATVHLWPGASSTEERIFLDVPLKAVVSLVRYAEEVFSTDSVKDTLNHACTTLGIESVETLALPELLDAPPIRRALGTAAKTKGWFKDIARAEYLGEVVGKCIADIRQTALGRTLAHLRQWIDA